MQSYVYDGEDLQRARARGAQLAFAEWPEWYVSAMDGVVGIRAVASTRLHLDHESLEYGTKH